VTGGVPPPGIRLIGIDIDGTLLDSAGRLSDANRDAIGAALDRGIAVALATGRSFRFARPIAEALPPGVTLIVSNGALVKTLEGETRLRRMLPAAVAGEVLGATAAYRGAAAAIFDGEAGERLVCEGMDWTHPARRRYYERFSDGISDCAPLERALTEDPIQVMFNGGVEPMRELIALLRAMEGSGGFEVALTEYPLRDFALVDVMARGCSKGSALAEWAGWSGCGRAEIMAIGDNYNDVEMLRFAGVPVVMGNAAEPLKSNGWHVTRSNDDSGVAAAIERFALAGANGRRKE
jgi:hypothetical protein